MDYTTLTLEVKQKPSESQAKSLYHICRRLPDGRQARGKRYELAGLVVLILLAKLSGEKTLVGACEWISYRKDQLTQMLGLPWKRMPCANTYSYALSRLDSERVNGILSDFLVRKEAESRCGSEPSRLYQQRDSQQHCHVAVDGKALRATGKTAYGGSDPQKHLLHVYEVETGIVLQQLPIAKEHSEVSTLRPLLKEAMWKGRVVTADALHTNQEFCRHLRRAQGDYVVLVKENVPVVRADLELFFEDPEADKGRWQQFEHKEKGHGRRERRQIITSPDLNDYFRREWQDLGQVFRLQRERHLPSGSSVEVVYGLTSLTSQRCSPQRLLSFIRGHWAVENRLHWRRDVILGEDSCPVRHKPVAQMLAVFNSTVLALMDLHHVSNVARQIRRFAAYPQEALTWLLDF